MPEGRPEQDATLGDDLLAGLFLLSDELLAAVRLITLRLDDCTCMAVFVSGRRIWFCCVCGIRGCAGVKGEWLKHLR